MSGISTLWLRETGGGSVLVCRLSGVGKLLAVVVKRPVLSEEAAKAVVQRLGVLGNLCRLLYVTLFQQFA